jgi:aralkylamine N-acetyltransferase
MRCCCAVIDVEKADFGPDPEAIVLSEVQGDAGSAKIIYRPGGEVDVGELAVLCDKVGWPKRPAEKVAGALKNSFLVRGTAI